MIHTTFSIYVHSQKHLMRVQKKISYNTIITFAEQDRRSKGNFFLALYIFISLEVYNNHIYHLLNKV